MKIFISDTHLAGRGDRRTEQLVRLIESYDADFYLLGDIFDFWVGNSQYFLDEYMRIVEALKKSSEKSRVFFVEGNHDFHLNLSEFGIKVTSKITQEISGRKVFISHGDMFAGESLHNFAHRILRSKTFGGFVNIMPDGAFIKIGKTISLISRQNNMRSSPYGKRRRIFNRMLKESIGIFSRGFDVVIFGHCHVPVVLNMNVNGRDCIYANPGFWGRNRGTYLIFDGREFSLKTVEW